MNKLEYSKEDIIEMQDSITWWTNRFNAVERDKRELKTKIDKAIQYIKWHYDLGTKEETSFCILRDNLLEILGGE